MSNRDESIGSSIEDDLDASEAQQAHKAMESHEKPHDRRIIPLVILCAAILIVLVAAILGVFPTLRSSSEAIGFVAIGSLAFVLGIIVALIATRAK